MRVPSDGLRFYCSILASEDFGAWLDNHTTNSVFLTRDVQQENAAKAQQLRNELIHFYRHNGDEKSSERFAKEGFDGYLGMEDLAAMSFILGRVIVLQVNELQISYGNGSLLLHVAYCTSKDAAGHDSGHYELYQSWRKVGPVEKKRKIAQDSRSGEVQPRPSPMPGTPQSQDDFVGVDDLFGNDRPGVSVFFRGADKRVITIGLVIFIVHSLRSVSISIEGGERLQAHKGTLYIYDNGSFVPFEGVLPEAVPWRVKRCLLEARVRCG